MFHLGNAKAIHVGVFQEIFWFLLQNLKKKKKKLKNLPQYKGEKNHYILSGHMKWKEKKRKRKEKGGKNKTKPQIHVCCGIQCGEQLCPG